MVFGMCSTVTCLRVPFKVSVATQGTVWALAGSNRGLLRGSVRRRCTAVFWVLAWLWGLLSVKMFLSRLAGHRQSAPQLNLGLDYCVIPP